MNATGAVERYVWMRCAEGGQIIGNLQEVRPLDRSTWDLMYSHFKAGGMTYENFRSWLQYVSIISQDNGRTWRLTGASDDQNDLRPAPYKFSLGWVKRVDDFRSAAAQEHIRTANSDGGAA